MGAWELEILWEPGNKKSVWEPTSIEIIMRAYERGFNFQLLRSLLLCFFSVKLLTVRLRKFLE